MSENFNENNAMPEPEHSSEYKGTAQKKKPVKLSIPTVAVVVILAVLLTFQITFVSQAKKYKAILNSSSNQNVNYQILSEISQIYEQYYVGEISDSQVQYGTVSGYVYGTGDKYGRYMSADEFASYSSTLSNKLVGIGITCIECDEPAGIEIIKVHSDSPAEKSGLQFGDIITHVDGQKVSDIGYSKAVDLVQGEENSKVNLTVFDPQTAQTENMEVLRKEVDVETVEYKIIQDNIGYIRITNFYQKTPTEFKNAVETLRAQNAVGLVFDLRGNPGGRLDAIVSVLDYLLPEGVIVRMTDSSGEFTSTESDANCIDMPMTVLVNSGTASAAELFTSALMDYKKATVIGTQTYGKGTVTTPFSLSDGSWIYVSTQLYYPPFSDNFEGVGITPDIVLELPEESKNTNLYKLTYDNDTQLQKAVEILKK